MTGPIGKIEGDFRARWSTLFGLERIGRAARIEATPATSLVLDHDARNDRTCIVAGHVNGSAFIAIAAEIGILHDFTRNRQIDRTRRRRPVLLDVNRDGMSARVIRKRANRAQPIETHVPTDFARIALRRPITRARRVFASIHQTPDFIEPYRGCAYQILVGPRHDRIAARLAGLAIDHVIRLVRAFRPGDTDHVESAFRHCNLARRVELVGAFSPIEFRRRTVGRVANDWLAVEVDYLDERPDFREGGGAGRIEVRNGRNDAASAAARDGKGKKTKCE